MSEELYKVLSDNWRELVAAETLKGRFDAAVRVIQNLPKTGPVQPSNDQKLHFYSAFKQATNGACKQPKPAFWDVIGRAKWDAWNQLGNMSATDAMEKYLKHLFEIVDVMEKPPALSAFFKKVDDEVAAKKLAASAPAAPATTPAAVVTSDAALSNGHAPVDKPLTNGHEPSSLQVDDSSALPMPSPLTLAAEPPSIEPEATLSAPVTVNSTLQPAPNSEVLENGPVDEIAPVTLTTIVDGSNENDDDDDDDDDDDQEFLDSAQEIEDTSTSRTALRAARQQQLATLLQQQAIAREQEFEAQIRRTLAATQRDLATAIARLERSEHSVADFGARLESFQHQQQQQHQQLLQLVQRLQSNGAAAAPGSAAAAPARRSERGPLPWPLNRVNAQTLALVFIWPIVLQVFLRILNRRRQPPPRN